jgi:hypothetical protein
MTEPEPPDHTISSKKQFASLQEELIFNFSIRILGPHALFCPENYGHSKEPADLVWIVNRCAILMYMQRSTSSYEKKRKHNLSQLHRWLRAWKGGQPLIGKSGDTTFEIAFSDIDHIVGLSIIGDGEIWCEYHADQVKYGSDKKLSACATLTEASLLRFAQLGAGPREILYWLSDLHQRGCRVSESAFLSALETQAAEAAETNRIGFSVTKDSFAMNALECIGYTFRSSKGHELDNEKLGGILVDLSLEDIFWFGYAAAKLSKQIALPGQHGHLVLGARRTSGIYGLSYAVVAHARIMKENMENFHAAFGDQPGLTLIHSLDMGRAHPWGTMIVRPRPGPSHIRQQIETLRSLALG